MIKFSESVSDVNISIDCLYELSKTYYCLIGKGESQKQDQQYLENAFQHAT